MATVRTEPNVHVELSEALFPWTPFSTAGDSRLYDLSADAQQILAIGLFSESGDGGKVVLVENWLGELERLVPTN